MTDREDRILVRYSSRRQDTYQVDGRCRYLRASSGLDGEWDGAMQSNGD